jgi:hypothetical protein
MRIRPSTVMVAAAGLGVAAMVVKELPALMRELKIMRM